MTCCKPMEKWIEFGNIEIIKSGDWKGRHALYLRNGAMMLKYCPVCGKKLEI